MQSLVEIPEGLEMIATTTARDGVHAESSLSILTVRLHNTMDYDIDLNFGDCKVVVNNDLLTPWNRVRAHEIITIIAPIELNEGIISSMSL